jgi:hypothetical protein
MSAIAGSPVLRCPEPRRTIFPCVNHVQWPARLNRMMCADRSALANFNHPNVTLQGTALGVKETTSHRGNDYTTFKLQDPSGCGAVNIFTWGHPALSNGDQVRVDGLLNGA